MVKIFFSKNCQVKTIMQRAIDTARQLKYGTKAALIFYGKTPVMDIV